MLATKPSCEEAEGIRWHDDWLDCSPPMPANVRNCSSTGSTATHGGIDPDLHWQPELWRALVERVDADPPHIRQQKTVSRLQEGPSDLPTRLSLFGHTRLASTDIELLQALSTHHDLHLWLPHPSDALWQKLGGHHGTIPRRADTSHREVDHPLLATLGRDLRELQRSLPADVQTNEYLPNQDRKRLTARLAASRHRRQYPSATRAYARRR